MTSGVFSTVNPADVNIDRERRQRREITPESINELAASIARSGLIHPPTVDHDLNLIAGERRTLAVRQLGWLEMPVQFIEDLSPAERHLIELEENVRRVELSWQDRVRAVQEYHEMRKELDGPEWSGADTAKALNISDTAFHRFISVAEELHDERVSSQDKLSTAAGVVERIRDRRKHEAKRDVVSDIEQLLTPASVQETSAGSPSEPAAPKPQPILNKDFKTWGPKYKGEPFNFIHCDFPYGIATGSKKGQSAARHLGEYDDSPGLYFELLNSLALSMDNLVSPSAHLMFWFSMKYYNETKAALEQMGWTVQMRPLIWAKSDNTGVIPDAQRGPRWVYETCFFASRGDRKIVKAVGDAFWGPTTKKFHTSEKSFDMLSHFFRMVVDEHTIMLDPTCGSGMAVKAARAAGALQVLGLEINKEFAADAVRNLEEEILLI